MAGHYGNFQRGLQRFGQTWNVTGKISPLKIEVDGAIAVWRTETSAKNWKVYTEFRALNWADVSSRGLNSWSQEKFISVAKALYDTIKSGTWWRYSKINWRFGLFFLYPVLAVLVAALLAYYSTDLLHAFSVPYAPLGGILIAAALFIAYVKWIDPIVLPSVVNMWVLIQDLVHDKQVGLAERLELFVNDIAAVIQSEKYDEVIIAGHGFGAALQVAIVDRVLWLLPDHNKNGSQISLLSTGSLLLAVALHPEGSWLVGPTSRLTRDKTVYWVEYQAEEDVMGFFGANPGEILVGDNRKPILQTVKIKNMVTTIKSYRSPRSLFQFHRQLVRANSKKYFYDFFMICCGPFSLQTRVEDPELMVSAFHADGRLVADS